VGTAWAFRGWCPRRPDANLAGEPRDDVAVPLADVTGSGVPVSALAVEQLRLRSALVRAVQASAVLDKIVELSAGYAAERVQFGRPLARFQAVQNLVVSTPCSSAPGWRWPGAPNTERSITGTSR
jgi:acyl-CoA dehydrogenase